MPVVTKLFESIQYDGTNGSFIAETWLAGQTLIADDGTTLQFQDREESIWTVPAGNRVIRQSAERNYVSNHTEQEYAVCWAEIPDSA